MMTPPNQLLDEIVAQAQTNQQDEKNDDIVDAISDAYDGVDLLTDITPDLIDAGSSALDLLGTLLEGLFSI